MNRAHHHHHYYIFKKFFSKKKKTKEKEEEKDYSIFVMNYFDDKYVCYNNWEIDHV